jgi:hypothetical protein
MHTCACADLLCTIASFTLAQQNPAVLRYDPTGLRSAMSATWAEMDKSLEQYRVSTASTTILLSSTLVYLLPGFLLQLLSPAPVTDGL